MGGEDLLAHGLELSPEAGAEAEVLYSWRNAWLLLYPASVLQFVCVCLPGEQRKLSQVAVQTVGRKQPC